MSLARRVIEGAEYRSVLGATSGLARPAGWLSSTFSGNVTAGSGQKVTADKALSVAPFWSAVTLISEAIGMLPLKVYRTLPDTDGETVPASDHRAWRMLHTQPNPVMPADRFWSTVAGHLLVHGNAYLLKVSSTPLGLVDELWPLDPNAVTVQWDSANRAKRYVIEGPPRVVYTDDDVLHIFGWSRNGLVGESILRVKNALGNAMARDEFEGSFWARGATLSGIIKHPGRLESEEDIKRLSTSFRAQFGGSGNAHGTPVLEENADYIVASKPLSELEFVAAQQLTRSDVAAMFHIPAAYLAASTGDSLTYATVESNQIQFATIAVAPWANTIAKALSADRQTFPFSSWYAEFVLEGLMRGDAKSRGEFYTLLSNLDAITVDEIRRRENMSPMPDGDLTPTERQAKRAPAPAPAPAPPVDNPEPVAP